MSDVDSQSQTGLNSDIIIIKLKRQRKDRANITSNKFHSLNGRQINMRYFHTLRGLRPLVPS